MTHSKSSMESLLDTDLYKLTMQAAVLQYFSDINVSYAFHNRNQEKRLNESATEWARAAILQLKDASVSPAELDFLRTACPFLPNTYLTFLSTLRLNPANEVQVAFDQSTRDIRLTITGRWTYVILYEVKVLSIISEAYFRFVDTDWNHDGQLENARRKAETLIKHGINFSEFGTRRRRDYKTHDLVLQGLMAASGAAGNGKLLGTSNVHFAHKYGLKPIGTVAHEWFMGVAAITLDYRNANKNALAKWADLYGDQLGIALTDTFGTASFLKSFDVSLASKYSGVRHDSGDPAVFTRNFVQHYQSLDIDPKEKCIVYSDGLNVQKCIDLQSLAESLGIQASFGIGTFFTNDFKDTAHTGQQSIAMNIVIKLSEADGQPTIKISDEESKHTGPADLLSRVQEQLNGDQ